MSEKTNLHVQAGQIYQQYGQRPAMPNAAYGGQYSGQGIPVGAHGALANLHSLKATLPSPSSADIQNNAGGRAGQNNPVMVLPSGQTVPVSAFFPPNPSHNDHLGYVPQGMFPGFVGGTPLTSHGMANYSWPYSMPNGVADLDPARRGSWSNDDSGALPPPINAGMQQDLYAGYQFPHPATANNQMYIAGPIQPMKTGDNKNYEMVNLDELVSREPSIPRAVPALWTNQEELSLAKCLQNPEGITNIYIRGFMPDTNDEDLHNWASRFGEIESCKAIIEQDTGKCKGFGFVMYYSPAAAENCIRGFFHLGFQASYAQKSRNSRLKDLEDRASTNIYCTGVPIDWNESDLAKHFLPYHAVSTKICRDSPSGVSKEVGFARFESRDIAERVVKDYHSALNENDGIKLFLRFADTKAQKQLKQQSQERRTWRSREYSYSVEHTPSPTVTRIQNGGTHISPNGSYQSPAAASNTFTPATSVSPPDVPVSNKVISATRTSWPMQGSLQSITNSSKVRAQASLMPSNQPYIQIPAKTDAAIAIKPQVLSEARRNETPSPKKVTINIEPTSGKENITTTPPQGHEEGFKA